MKTKDELMAKFVEGMNPAESADWREDRDLMRLSVEGRSVEHALATMERAALTAYLRGQTEGARRAMEVVRGQG